MRVFPERTRDFGAPFARLQSERIQRDALRVERDLYLRAQRGLCVRKFRRDAVRALLRGNRDGPAPLRLGPRAGKDIEIQRAGAQIETPLPLTVFVAKAAAAFDLCALNQTDAQIGEGLRLRVELRFGMQIDQRQTLLVQRPRLRVGYGEGASDH